MEASDFKRKFLAANSPEITPEIARKILSDEGVEYNFDGGFEMGILNRIVNLKGVVSREFELLRNINLIFSRVALSGVAAILILLITILLSGETVSVDTLLGMGDTIDETVLTVLAGY